MRVTKTRTYFFSLSFLLLVIYSRNALSEFDIQCKCSEIGFNPSNNNFEDCLNNTQILLYFSSLLIIKSTSNLAVISKLPSVPVYKTYPVVNSTAAQREDGIVRVGWVGSMNTRH